MLNKAVGMHQSGDTAGAIEIYESIIARVPGHFDATHLLGVAALQEGRFDQARESITLALRINREHPAALNNRHGTSA